MTIDTEPARRALAACLVALTLAAAGCTATGELPAEEEEGRVSLERNSAFRGPELDVFVRLRDGTRVAVDTASDTIGIEQRDRDSIVPGWRVQAWTMRKDGEKGTSLVYAVASWAPENPDDYLMFGEWIQLLPVAEGAERDWDDVEVYGIVDGTEIDPAHPPDLPVSGTADYAGVIGGTYSLRRGEERIFDQYEGTATFSVDFAANAVTGCMGCTGDLLTRPVSHFSSVYGTEVLDTANSARDYEIRFRSGLGENGIFETEDVTVSHPTRTVAATEGFLWGILSNRPDTAGAPRLAAGFNSARFEEANGDGGRFYGIFFATGAELQGRR